MRFFAPILFLCVNILIVKQNFSQTISQEIIGKISDKLSGMPLEGANIFIDKSTPIIGAGSNKYGEFKIENVPVGRYTLVVQHIAYQNKYIYDIQVSSSQKTDLQIELIPQSNLVSEVKITDTYEAINSLDFHSFTGEEINRYAATFNDPARLSTSLAGIATLNDQSNHIVVHGNSPNANAWYLNGLAIANPNHLTNAGTFSDQPSTSGGGVNILSSHLLSTSNFYTCNYPLNFSNALGGIYDMRFRNGNKNETNYSIQAGAIGLEASAEGPFNKSTNNSYLANYRYSTVGLLSQFGVDFGNEQINYTDLSFNLNFDFDSTHKSVSLFGIFGSSKNDHDFIDDEAKIESDKDLQKILYNDFNLALGSTYNKFYKKSQLEIGLLLSVHSADRDANITLDKLNSIRFEKLESEDLMLSNSIIYTIYIQKNVDFRIGNTFELSKNNVVYSVGDSGNTLRNYIIDGQRLDFFMSRFIQINFSPNKSGWYSKIGMKSDLHYTKNDLGKHISNPISYKTIKTDEILFLMPYLKIGRNINKKQSIDLSYQLNHQNQNEFITLTFIDTIAPNANLKSTKSHNFNLNNISQLGNNFILKSQIYYQYLYDVPIINNTNRIFSLLNNHEEIITDSLSNKGTGENYGIDISVQKQFTKNYYLLSNLSLYRSTFEDGSGKTRSTKYDGKYLINLTTGYELARKKNKNSFININARFFIQGGYRYTPIDILASDQNNTTIFKESETNTLQYPDYFRMDAGIRFIKNKNKATRTWSIDIQNLTNTKNIAYKYYDIYFNQIKSKFHLGLIPVFNYKIEF